MNTYFPLMCMFSFVLSHWQNNYWRKKSHCGTSKPGRCRHKKKRVCIPLRKLCVCMYQCPISLLLPLCCMRFMPCCTKVVIRTMYFSLVKLPTNPSLSTWLRSEACTERFVAAALWKVPGPWDTDVQAVLVNGLNLLVTGSNVGFHLVAVTKVITL